MVLPNGRAYPLTEAAFQRQVEDLLDQHGWRWMHIPRSQTGKRFRTMATGPLARGWPDLLILRGATLRALELKTDKGRTTEDQDRVLGWLGEAIRVDVVRPRDWAELEASLR